MQRGERKLFQIGLRYFKPNGKWYTDTVFDYVTATIEGTDDPYMNDVVAHIRGLRDGGGQGALPGLHHNSEGWDGFIEVYWFPDGFPTLILPKS